MSLKLVLPKGRINTKVLELLSDCGITLTSTERNYRPQASGFDLEVKLLKSQNIPSLVAMGQHDIGFAGLDWIEEKDADVAILKDLNFDPVKIVACIPEDWDWQSMQSRALIVASEYKNISTRYLDKLGVDYQLLRSYGATEVFPPEDADMIIDNTSTGTTITANRLKIVDTVTVLNGRERVLLEMNCGHEQITQIVSLLPAMRYPTVSPLYQDKGFAVKTAVLKSQIRELIPNLISAGATDILETSIRKAL